MWKISRSERLVLLLLAARQVPSAPPPSLSKDSIVTDSATLAVATGATTEAAAKVDIVPKESEGGDILVSSATVRSTGSEVGRGDGGGGAAHGGMHGEGGLEVEEDEPILEFNVSRSASRIRCPKL